MGCRLEIKDIDKLNVALREERAKHHRTTASEFMRIGAYNLAKISLAHAECFMPSQENKQLWAELVSKASCLQPEEEFILDPSQPLFSLLFSAGRENK